MFGIGWVEISMIMTLVVFAMTIFMTIYSFLMKQGQNHERAAIRPTPPVGPDFGPGVRLHFLIVFILFVILVFSPPLAWAILGQAGMPLVRLATILLLLVCLYAIISGAIFVSRRLATAVPGPASDFPLRDASQPQVDLIARITQRFCPRCRAPLAADAPEGLCPACLMAGGLESRAVIDPASGPAVTTPHTASSPASGDWTDLAAHFPQLEILELLGRGGMGAVYKARQKNLDRFVALKVIPPDAAKDPTFAERFAREARALARLNHANIVTVYDFGQTGDIYYLLMEYVDGVNLRHAQAASRLAPQEALAIVPQICDALQYAHDQGVVHRDIKPENILLDRGGRVKIADFGLAKMLGKGPDNFTLTHAQQVMGTPRYMAPEQIETPSAVDHRADIYSLGVVLYEMLTGELPMGRFEPPSHKVQLDVRIDQVVLRSLEKEPNRRYQRASQLKTELASMGGWPQTEASHRGQASDRPTWETPRPVAKYPTSATSSPESNTWKWKFAVVVFFALPVAICSGLIALLVTYALFSVGSIREAARQTHAMNNLKQLGVALHNYQDVYGSFPPAVVEDEDGEALYSGRVLLLPFLEQEALYRSFDLAQAWDSPRNRWISDTTLKVFQDPSADGTNPGRTDYVFITGKGTIFEEGKNVKITDVLDGLSQTMMMVTVNKSGKCWAQPFDFDLTMPTSLPGTNHSNNTLILFGDGSVRAMSTTVPPTEVRAMATAAGGEHIPTLWAERQPN